jgi:hypothetical protein
MSKANKTSKEPTAPEKMLDEEIPFIPLWGEGDGPGDGQYVIPLHLQHGYSRVSPPEFSFVPESFSEETWRKMEDEIEVRITQQKQCV